MELVDISQIIVVEQPLPGSIFLRRSCFLFLLTFSPRSISLSLPRFSALSSEEERRVTELTVQPQNAPHRALLQNFPGRSSPPIATLF